jgi:hypothetical protein
VTNAELQRFATAPILFAYEASKEFFGAGFMLWYFPVVRGVPLFIG